MARIATDDRLVLTDGSVDPDSGAIHATAPFIVGLVGAVLGLAMIAPDMLRHAQMVVVALLVPAMLVSVGIYAWSVINPGDVVGVIVDAGGGRLEIVQSNPFAQRRSAIPLRDILRIETASAYDRDGYATAATVVVLRTGERLELRFGLDAGQLAALRRLLGQR